MNTRRRTFDPTAPAGLKPPTTEDLRSQFDGRKRADYIIDHGFSEQQILPSWWKDRLDTVITFPGVVEGIPKLTRGALFAMAERAGDSEGAMLAFVWHVLAWGSGTSRRNMLRRTSGIQQHAELLRPAFEAARNGDPRLAYSSLIQPGRARIPWFGPAFFSKFLYFASEGATNRCLILDARVARSLSHLGWRMSPGSFSYNWHTATYVSYCELLSTWAEQISSAHGDLAGTSADMLERFLFEGGRGV